MNRRDARDYGEGRRRFLRKTLFGTAALFVAPVLPSGFLRAQVNPDIAKKLLFFSQHECLVLAAAAARLTGYPPALPSRRSMWHSAPTGS